MLLVKDSKQSGGAAKKSGAGPAEPRRRPVDPAGQPAGPAAPPAVPEGSRPVAEGSPPMAEAPPAVPKGSPPVAEEPPPGTEVAPPGTDAGETPSPGRAPAQPESDIALALGDLAGRLGNVEEQLAEFHRRAAHREAVIDRLHEENKRLAEGLGRAFLDPVIADLIRLYDQLRREVRRLEASGLDAKLLGSFADEVVQILDRCGVEAFSANPGDVLQRGRHRPLAAVACDDESRHNTLAEVVTAGFADRETGRVRRPVQARVFQYSGDPGAAGQAPSTARSL